MPKNKTRATKRDKTQVIGVNKVTAEKVDFLPTTTISRREFKKGMKAPGIALGKKLITPSCFRRRKRKNQFARRKYPIRGRVTIGPNSPRH